MEPTDSESKENELYNKLKQESFDREISKYQRTNFNERYIGASMSKLEGDVWSSKQILNYMKNPKHFLVYTGSPGCGKTYFCAALTEWSFIKFNTRRYHREEDLLRKLRQGISEGNGDYLIALEYMIDDDFIILDDVASGINPDKCTHRDLEFRREVFFSFLDYRYNCQKPTVITSNLNRKQFCDVYSERIASRIFAKENTIIEMYGENLDKRQDGK